MGGVSLKNELPTIHIRFKVLLANSMENGSSPTASFNGFKEIIAQGMK